MRWIVVKLLINAAAIWVAAWILPGVSIGGTTVQSMVVSLFVVGAIFGIVNTVIKPLVKLVALPFYLLSLGLVSFLVNALMLKLVGWLAHLIGVTFDAGHFFWDTILAAIVISLVSWGLQLVISDED
jgi:putative membrane protein